jgi:tellurite resistance protein TehA-like permease
MLNKIRDFYPGYFSLVMATGIISIACHFLNMHFLAWFLFYANIVFYIVVWAITLIRIFLFPNSVWTDLTGHAKGPAFFTVVAGTCVLGSQFSILQQATTTSIALWILGLILWIFLIYTVLTAVTVAEPKPQFENSLSGAWLIIVVATQSVSVLGSLVAPHLKSAELVLFFALCMYLLGCMLYIPIISMIFYRWTFFRMTAIQLTPPYWINMGALAITTLAGSRLILNTSNDLLLQQLSPFLKGFTFFFWATGSWWIPLLIILGAWRHGYKKIPLNYDPQFWGIVFPLGMYTTATFILGVSTHVDALKTIAGAFIYIALLSWVITFAGMAKSVVSVFRRPSAA